MVFNHFYLPLNVGFVENKMFALALLYRERINVSIMSTFKHVHCLHSYYQSPSRIDNIPNLRRQKYFRLNIT